MSLSLSETVCHIEDLKQQLAVWNSIANHLAKFLDTEAREAADGIPAPGCVRPELRVRGKEVVPQEVIFNIIQGIEAEKISPLSTEIKALENLKVVETKNGDQQSQRQEDKLAQQKNQKRVRVVAQPG